MDKAHLGNALIINNYRFHNSQLNRENGERDAVQLNHVLQQIGFKVLLRHNLTAKVSRWLILEIIYSNPDHQILSSRGWLHAIIWFYMLLSSCISNRYQLLVSGEDLFPSTIYSLHGLMDEPVNFQSLFLAMGFLDILLDPVMLIVPKNWQITYLGLFNNHSTSLWAMGRTYQW